MNTKRILFSLLYGVMTSVVDIFATAGYVEALTAPNFQRDGLGPLWDWTCLCILGGIVVFIVGLFGKLPGTKSCPKLRSNTT